MKPATHLRMHEKTILSDRFLGEGVYLLDTGVAAERRRASEVLQEVCARHLVLLVLRVEVF